MNITTQTEALVAEVVANLAEPGITVAQAASILEPLRQHVYDNVPPAKLEAHLTHRIAAALEVALDTTQLYDPEAATWLNEEGDIEQSPLLNLIEAMRILGMAIVPLQLSEPGENLQEFLGMRREIEMEHTPDTIGRPSTDVTNLTAAWIYQTLAEQLGTTEEPGLFVDVTMNAPWSFERETSPIGYPTEVCFSFGEWSVVRAALLIDPNPVIEESGDLITLYDVKFVVRVSTTLDMFSDGPHTVSQETRDAALYTVEEAKLKRLTYDRSTRMFVGYVKEEA